MYQCATKCNIINFDIKQFLYFLFDFGAKKIVIPVATVYRKPWFTTARVLLFGSRRPLKNITGSYIINDNTDKNDWNGGKSRGDSCVYCESTRIPWAYSHIFRRISVLHNCRHGCRWDSDIAMVQQISVLWKYFFLVASVAGAEYVKQTKYI